MQEVLSLGRRKGRSMSGRIIIVDSSSASRILLRATLQSAHYNADAVATPSEAEALMAAGRPDLIILGLSGNAASALSFCAMLQADPHRASIPVIAVAIAAGAAMRLAALRAGADDVLDRLSGQTYLLARIRSLIRSRDASVDLNLRENTHRALGLSEDGEPFARPGRIAIITADLVRAPGVLAALVARMPDQVRLVDPDTGPGPASGPSALADGTVPLADDVYLIDGTGADAGQLCRLVSDLRSWPRTRHAEVLALLPPDHQELAALALDLGAGDVADTLASTAELAHRVQVLLRRKADADRLRVRLSHGLEAAVTDPLTGLPNRRYALSQLAQLAERATAEGSGLAVMMVDVDHFKAVNDLHGHAAGDRVLTEVARRLRGCLTTRDLLARVGGEEFLIVLPDATAQDSTQTADRLRRVIGETGFDLSLPFTPQPARPLLRITVSVGLALQTSSSSVQAVTPQVIVEHADRALYSAKAAGRNRVGETRITPTQSAAQSAA